MKIDPITFEIRRDGHEMRKVVLTEPVIKVGAFSSTHLHLEGDEVSRMHAYIKFQFGAWRITDLGSSYGTWVNGERFNNVARLKSGDVVKFGDVEVTVKFEEAEKKDDFHQETAKGINRESVANYAFRQVYGCSPPSVEKCLEREESGTAQKIHDVFQKNARCPKCGEPVHFVEEEAEVDDNDDIPTTRLVVMHKARLPEGGRCTFKGTLGEWLGEHYVDKTPDAKKGSLKRAEEELEKPKKLWHPGRDGEAYLWRLLREKGPTLTEPQIKKHLVEDKMLDWEYISSCLEFMVEAGAVVFQDSGYRIEPELLKAHLEREEEIANRPTYYCEQCFHIRGEIVVMWEGTTSDGTKNRLYCRKCQGEWKLNQGQARHVTSLKLQHYRKLAEKLGILEIEEEAPPFQTDRSFYELRTTIRRLIKHWRGAPPRERLKTVDEALKHVVDNLHSVLSKSYVKKQDSLDSLCPGCVYFSDVPGEGCNMLQAPHPECPDFREKEDR